MSYDVVLLPSFAQVEAWRKARAQAADACSLGQTVATFESWIADLWELHGDGRLVVGGMQRHMAMSLAAQSLGLLLPKGTIRVAIDCVRRAAGVPAFEDAVARAESGADAGVSPREAEFLSLMACYYRELEERGLVEFGHAVAALAERSEAVFPRGKSVLVAHAGPLSWIQRHFFTTCDELSLVVEQAAGAEGIGRAPEGVQVRFAFPSGGLAEPGLVADLVEAAEGKSVVVACKDPIGLFECVESRLAGSRRLCLQARKPFGLTDFGRAFLECCRAVNDELFDPAALSDVLSSMFSGLSKADAVRADTDMRADRTLGRADALARWRAAAEPFSQLEEIATEPDANILLGAFEQAIQSTPSQSAAWKAEQLAAVRVLREATDAARLTGMGMSCCVDALQHVQVPFSACDPGCGAEVLVTSQDAAAQLPPKSHAVTIVADLTSDAYPVADKDDAASTLFARIGMTPPETALARARRDFCALLALPSETICLVRPLGDENADETYPCVVLEEFVDAYRDDPSATEDINNSYRLPDCLKANVVTRGEELLYANARAAAPRAQQAIESADPARPLDFVSAATVDKVVVRRRDSQGNELADACPSPSQIEAYLECPFKWFASRRLRLEGVDEGFGPLEQGTFVHSVLEEFYRRFQEAGHEKVNADNLEAARELMSAVAFEAAARQAEKDPGDRYVAVTELERHEVSQLCLRLIDYLDFEAALLPTFGPAYLEFKIDADDPADYAGHLLVGTVDRIDVDGAGHAVIIDYKASVNGEHEIAGKTADHAGKVQTRIYARAVERVLGLQVIGALYVTYGKNPTVSGAYDSRFLEAAHLPGMRHDHCSAGALEEVPQIAPEDYSLKDLRFDVMLDETERIVADAIARMKAGDVGARPSYAKACTYCPVAHCPKRGE